MRFLSSKRVITAAVVFTVFAISRTPTMSAQAAEFPWTSGNAFLRTCGAYQQPPSAQAGTGTWSVYIDCISYVRGVSDGISTLGRQVEGQVKSQFAGEICLPTDVENQQLMRVVIAYMQSKPEDLHWPSAWLVHLALIHSFGCKAPASSPVPTSEN
jgi:Rap1a immunity proteins